MSAGRIRPRIFGCHRRDPVDLTADELKKLQYVILSRLRKSRFQHRVRRATQAIALA